MTDSPNTTTGLFGDTLPPALSPQAAAARREADVLLLAVPAHPGALWIDQAAMPAARELVRQGRARLVWLPDPGVYELRRSANV